MLCCTSCKTYHISIRFTKHAMGKYSHYEEINDEGNKQCNGSFNEKIKICFTNFAGLATINITRLYKPK